MKKILYLIVLIIIIIAVAWVVWDRTPDETANWQVYKSSEFGYSLKIPKNWRVEAVQSDDGFYSPQGLEFTFSSSRGMFLAPMIQRGEVVFKDNVNLGDAEVFHYESKKDNVEFYETTSNNGTLLFFIRNSADKETVFKVLSTLQFTN